MANIVPVYQHEAGSGSTIKHYYDLNRSGSSGWSNGKIAFYAYDGPTSEAIPVYIHSVQTNDGTYYYYDLQVSNNSGWTPGKEAFWVPKNSGPGVQPVYWSLTAHNSYHYALQPSMLPQDDARVVAPPQSMFNALAQLTYAHNWMSGLDETANIAQISIPGSHESCARYGGSSAHCQWRSIIDQLNRGIRFLDIRCDYSAPKGNVAGSPVNDSSDPNIYLFAQHGTMVQSISFEEVQAQCIAFLNDNPDEFILMNLQMEQTSDGDAFRKKFLELTAPYLQYWYFGDGIRIQPGFGPVPSFPTLKDVRKHIALVRAYDLNVTPPVGWSSGGFQGGFEWNGFNVDGTSTNLIFQTQNGWGKWNGTDKGAQVEDYIKRADAWARTG